MGCVQSVPPIPPPEPPRPPPVKFSSGTVTKEIDERKDEHPLEPTEEDYPQPAPAHSGTDEIRPKNRWFQNTDYENSSDEVDLHEIELSSDDATSRETMHKRRDEVKNKKLPTISFEKIDKNAKQADWSLSFEQLITYLTKPIPNNDYNREVLTARAIVVWLAEQDVDHTHYGVGSLDTPRGMLQLLKDGKMTYATCYTRLCRQANLKCTLVKGLVKATSYEPGNKHAPSTQWTAVYVDGGWQLVQPFWMCRALFGHNLGGWVKIEKDGTTLAEREKASVGVVRNTFQQHYFMPKPQQFVHECYAEDAKWQLLPDAEVVKSEKDFLNMPYLLPPFFGMGLELVNQNSCSLTTEKGRCNIVLRAKPGNAHMLVLKYELFAKTESKTLQKDNRASRMVFNSRANEMFEFDIRFPESGDYKFIIYGGPFKSPALRLCEFQIICPSPMKPFHLLPFACDDIGWGPGPKSVAFGLLMPSRVSGFVNVPQLTQRKTEMTFQLHPDMINSNKYGASLHRQLDGEKLEGENYVKCKTDANGSTLMITVKLPNDEEFGLAITCTRKVADDVDLETTICNYLLSTANSRRVKTEVNLAKAKLMKALESDIHLPEKVKEVAICIENCRKKRIDELDEDFCAAKTRFEHLYYKNELRDAILRRFRDVAIRTLLRLERYKYKATLQHEIRAVEKMVDDLQKEKDINN